MYLARLPTFLNPKDYSCISGHVNYSTERSRRQRLEDAVRANEEAVKLSNERYVAGLTDFLSVLDAQRELYANEDLLAQSRTVQTLDLIALYKVLGGGWQPFSQP